MPKQIEKNVHRAWFALFQHTHNVARATFHRILSFWKNSPHKTVTVEFAWIQLLWSNAFIWKIRLRFKSFHFSSNILKRFAHLLSYFSNSFVVLKEFLEVTYQTFRKSRMPNEVGLLWWHAFICKIRLRFNRFIFHQTFCVLRTLLFNTFEVFKDFTRGTVTIELGAWPEREECWAPTLVCSTATKVF